MPADIADAITSAYRSLAANLQLPAANPQLPVAVRSSATAEDLPEPRDLEPIALFFDELFDLLLDRPCAVVAVHEPNTHCRLLRSVWDPPSAYAHS